MFNIALFFCRGDRIRTCDPLVPNQVRYQLRHAPKTDFINQERLLYSITLPVKSIIVFYCCRGDRIRTCDPLVPNQVRYQLRHAPKTSCIKNPFSIGMQSYFFFFTSANILPVKVLEILLITVFFAFFPVFSASE